jgi:hypothetical protein
LTRHSDEEEAMTTLRDDEIQTLTTGVRKLEPSADADGDDADPTDGDADADDADADGDGTDGDGTDGDGTDGA